LIALSGNKLSVEDLDSANGTFLNGKRIRDKQSVSPGDLLEVGPLTFSVQFQFSTPAETGKYEPKKQAGVAGDWIPLADTPASNAEGWVVVEAEEVADDRPVTQPMLSAEGVELEVVGEGDTDAPHAKKAADDKEEFDVILDDCEPLNLPPDADLRDIISKMDK
jgi:pSer/pThr/pTyr-binding forkhead associated (FHA) protein